MSGFVQAHGVYVGFWALMWLVSASFIHWQCGRRRGNTTINIYTLPHQDVRQLAEEVNRRLKRG